MTKFRGALCAAAITALLVIAVAGSAFAAPRPVAFNNTPASGFAPAQTCNCHSNFLDEWQQSMHSKALTDPLFTTKVAEGNAATGGKIGPFCLKCHGPVATMTGGAGGADAKTASAQGIGCSFCHQVTGGTAPTNNVALMVDPSGIYRATIATPTAPHATAYSAFHATSAICGSCHNVSHPGNGLPIEATYTEWIASPQAKAGVQCQDCHMSASPGLVGPSVGWDAGGGPLRRVYQMSFMGAQVGLGNGPLAVGMLQSAAKLTLETTGAAEGGAPTSATVTVTNTGAGHNLPTGITELREMFVQVSIVAPDGKETVIGKHQYGTVLKDAAGKAPADIWTAVAVQSDDRIPPGGTSVSSFKIVFPEGVNYGTLHAKLLYRSAPEALAKKAGAANPTTVMAEASQDIFANAAGQKQATAVILAEASASPLTPLVIAVLGTLLSIGLIILFVVLGRRSAKGGNKAPARKRTTEVAKPDDEAAASADEPAAAPAEEVADAPKPDVAEGSDLWKQSR
jgi:hypothetical protein